MRAALVTRPGTLTVAELEMPTPGPYDALCILLYGATCTGTDLHIIDGGFPWANPLPTVPGHESAGRVLEIGSHVRHLAVGDLVTRVGAVPPEGAAWSATWGGFAEYGLARDWKAMQEDGIPEAEWRPHRWNQVVPSDIDARQAPMFTTWRETLSYVQRMDVAPGQRVLIAGSGGNGLAFARHCLLLGAHVCLMGSPNRFPAAEALGVRCCVDYHSESIDVPLNAFAPDGFDRIIDAVGKKSLCVQLLPHIRPGGLYGIYGIDDYGELTLDPALAPGPFTEHPCVYDEAETHDRVINWVRAGLLDARYWYDPDHPWPLERIEEAFDSLRRREAPKALMQLA